MSFRDLHYLKRKLSKLILKKKNHFKLILEVCIAANSVFLIMKNRNIGKKIEKKK